MIRSYTHTGDVAQVRRRVRTQPNAWPLGSAGHVAFELTRADVLARIALAHEHGASRVRACVYDTVTEEAFSAQVLVSILPEITGTAYSRVEGAREGSCPGMTSEAASFAVTGVTSGPGANDILLRIDVAEPHE